jgi:hypothetical protein
MFSTLQPNASETQKNLNIIFSAAVTALRPQVRDYVLNPQDRPVC